MKIKPQIVRSLALLALFTLNPQLATFAQDTAFTYQGRLLEGGGPVHGIFDLQFTVYDADTNGSAVSVTVTNADTLVTNGLFAVTLDFGSGVFTGPKRWLDIGVRTNGAAGFDALAPRQPIMPVPRAIMANVASNLLGSLPVEQLTGTVPLSQLPGAVLTNNASGVTLNGAFSGDGSGLTGLNANNIATGTVSPSRLPGAVLTNNASGVTLTGSFSGNGSSLTALNANNITTGTIPLSQLPGAVLTNNASGVTMNGTFSGDGSALTGLTADNIATGTVPEARLGANLARTNQVWLLAGNSGTTPGVNFLGTTDNKPLELWVNNTRALRLEPNNTNSPNVIGGNGSNSVADGYYGSTIAGGGSSSGFNSVAAIYSTIGGGRGNTIQSVAHYSTIGGGWSNLIQTNANYSTIAGGWNSTIQSNAYASAIGGGYSGLIQTNAYGSTIAGGWNNTVQAAARSSTIGGGRENTVYTSALFATIPGGYQALAFNYGQMAYASGDFNNAGDAQTSVYVCRNTTTNATLTELFVDGGARRMLVPTTATWTFDILVTARATTGTSAGYRISGVVKNISGTTALVGTPTVTSWADAGASTWSATVVAGDAGALSALEIKVAGAAATTNRWVANVRTSDVSY